MTATPFHEPCALADGLFYLCPGPSSIESNSIPLPPRPGRSARRTCCRGLPRLLTGSRGIRHGRPDASTEDERRLQLALFRGQRRINDPFHQYLGGGSPWPPPFNQLVTCTQCSAPEVRLQMHQADAEHFHRGFAPLALRNAPARRVAPLSPRRGPTPAPYNPQRVRPPALAYVTELMTGRT